VFDKGQQQQSRPPASDLSRSLVELSRKYGLHVELETEGEAAAGKPEKCDDSAAKCAKSNILSTVCGQAQRLWNQGQMAFKGGDSGNRGVDAEKDVVDGDVESGRVDAVPAGKAAPVQNSPCTVTTVSETLEVERPARNHGGSLRYHTLEYGASPVDAEAQSSPDSGVQCCTVNPSENVRTQPDKNATAALTVTVDRDVAAEKDKNVAAEETVKDVRAVTAVDKDEAVKAEKDEAVAVPDKNATVPPLKTVDIDDGGSKPSATVAKPVQKNGDEPKHANPPPPPPPRKYSAPVAPPTVPATAAVAVTRATAAAAVARADNVTAAAPEPTPVLVVCAEPAKPSTAAPAISEIRVDDDYYWCTTTAMAPPMSTFGKRPSATPSVEIGTGDGGAVIGSGGATAAETGAAAAETATVIGGGDAVAAETTAAVIGHKDAAAVVFDKGFAVAALVADDGRDVVAGATTSIEDASLPSFSSDEEEDDEDNNCNNNALAVDKSKFPPCSTIDDTSTVHGVGTGTEVGKDSSGGNVTKTECNGVSLNNNNNNNNNKNKNDIKNICDDAPPAAAEPKSPVTKLPTLRLSLSSPLSSTAATSCCSSSASSTSSTSPSPTNSSFNNSPIVSKIPVRRQSAGSGLTAVSAPPPQPLANGSAKKSIPLPLSRSGSRLAMWSSAN